MRRLIVTGDDFGLALAVNEAIEQAHRSGILTSASLMVAAGGAADAVERARRNPALRVGLHLVLVEGRPVLAPEEIPDLVGPDGEFLRCPARASFKFFFRPTVRRQLEAEIRAQFERFRSTGLELDHVNAHNHMHLNPAVLGIILKVGREFALRAVRVPHEPAFRSWRASQKPLLPRLARRMLLLPYTGLMKRRLRRARLSSNDFVFGLHDSGAMHLDLVLRFLDRLPEGVTEIYFHPATRRCPEIDRTMPDYHHEDELRALTDDSIRQALLAARIERIAFSDL